MKTRAKRPHTKRRNFTPTSAQEPVQPLPHQTRPIKTPPRQHAHKTPKNTKNPQHTPGENNKSIQTCQNTGIRRSFQKTVKTGSHQVKHYPVCQKQYPIITHENHNKRSCYTAVYYATPTQGAVTRTTITTTITTIITNVFQVIRGFPLIIPETYPLPAEQHTQGLTAIFNK